MVPIRIQMRAIPGGWRLSVGRVELRPTSVDLDEDQVLALAERLRSLLRVPTVSHSDTQRTRAEEAAGTLLIETLFGDVAVSQELHGLLGEARGRNQSALVLIDVPDPVPRALPWELLGLGEPLEAAGTAIIARITRGSTAKVLQGPASVRVVNLDPDDPICQQRDTELRQQLDQLGLAIDEQASILHLIAHGDRADGSTWLALTDRNTSAGSVAHLLQPLLESASLVVLDICDAGSVEVDEHAAVAARFVRHGADAVVAPITRLARSAAEAFGLGLYASLHRGDTIADAVSAGRRAVRGRALPHPDGRWCNLSLILSDAAAASRRFAEAPWHPTGWEHATNPMIAPWLNAARNLAEPHGFVGLEHVLAAVPVATGRWLTQLRYLLNTVAPPLEALRTLHPGEDRQPAWSGTPRLQEHTPPAGLDLDGFAAWLCTELDGAVPAMLGSQILHLPGVDGTQATLEVDALSSSGIPAGGVEVLGGPEDGRWFGPGDTVGRASGGTDGLYRDTWLTDPYLPRQALLLDDPYCLRKGADLGRDGKREALPPGPVELERDDQLWLSRSTRLRAR